MPRLHGNASPDPDRIILGGVGEEVNRSCKFGCRYCFAAEPNYPHKPSAHDVLSSSEAIVARASVLMLGSDTELFQDPAAAHQTLQAAALTGRDVTFATKANLPDRTLHFLAELANEMRRKGQVMSVMVSIPTLSNAKDLEPQVPSPLVRFRLVERLRSHGLNPFVGIRPLLPPHHTTDADVLEIVRSTVDATHGFIFGPYWFDRDVLGLIAAGTPVKRRPVHWLPGAPTWWIYEDAQREARLKAETQRLGGVVWERSSEAVRRIRALLFATRPVT